MMMLGRCQIYNDLAASRSDPMLTVHDELCFNIENKQQAERISEIMTTCVPNLNIPFEVDTALVDNWGEVE